MTGSVQKRRNKNTMTDWEDLYHRNQLSSLRVGELELYTNHHNIAFKGEKDEKVWVVRLETDGEGNESSEKTMCHSKVYM